MISAKIKNKIANGSAIRKMFEEGNRLRAIYGPEKVFMVLTMFLIFQLAIRILSHRRKLRMLLKNLLILIKKAFMVI